MSIHKRGIACPWEVELQPMTRLLLWSESTRSIQASQCTHVYKPIKQAPAAMRNYMPKLRLANIGITLLFGYGQVHCLLQQLGQRWYCGCQHHWCLERLRLGRLGFSQPNGAHCGSSHHVRSKAWVQWYQPPSLAAVNTMPVCKIVFKVWLGFVHYPYLCCWHSSVVMVDRCTQHLFTKLCM